MSFPITCPKCKTQSPCPDQFEGKRVKCKKCAHAFTAERVFEGEVIDDIDIVDEVEVVDGDDVVEEKKPSKTSAMSRALDKRKGNKSIRDNDEDEDEAPRPKSRKPARDDDDEEEKRPRPKSRKAARDEEDEEGESPRTKGRNAARDEEDDDEAPRTKERKATRDEEDDDEAPRRRRKASRADDDDDDDEDERPRSKSKKTKERAGPPVLLFVLLGVLCVLVIGGGIGLRVWLAEDEKVKDPKAVNAGGGIQAKNPPAQPGGGGQAGWIDFTDPERTFTAQFPKQPTRSNDNQATIYSALDGTHAFLVVIAAAPGVDPNFEIPDQVINLTLDQTCDRIIQSTRATELTRKTITINGIKGKEVSYRKPNGSGGMARFFYYRAKVYGVSSETVTGPIDQAKVQRFLDGMQISR